jgi:methylamine--corrinoid protein Co-methyltransferase
MLLYETAAMAATATTSGATRIMGPRSAAGTVPGHASGLEARWMGEVARACAGMSRRQANDLVTKLLSTYSEKLGAKDVQGKSFDQVYDLSALRPTAGWLATYDEVKSDVAAFGLPV